ncbi:MAG: DegT/DnrJ/EryC1/StrS aminotransferase family protein [Aquihabitans sp.]
MARAASDPIIFAVPDINEDDVAAVTAVLRSGWITTGSECQMLEAELAAYLGAEHVIAVSSCTAALEIALAHLALPAGARVGVPAWTFVSSALAAVHNNLQPVLLDVEPSTLNLCPESLQSALTEGLDAVVAVHFGGVAVDPMIHKLCADADVPLIEDAAHALGAADQRGLIGGPGSFAACFSFYATKNLTSSEGGAIATNDAGLAAYARSHRIHGMSADAHDRYKPGGGTHYDLLSPGIKANLPDVLAALARSQLTRFPAMQSRRRAILGGYRAALEPRGITFVPEVADPASADHLAVILLPEGTDRPHVVAGLKARGINPSVHFRPLHHFTWFAENATVGPNGLAVCDALADRTLSLPLHVNLSDADVAYVSDALLELVGS